MRLPRRLLVALLYCSRFLWVALLPYKTQAITFFRRLFWTKDQHRVGTPAWIRRCWCVWMYRWFRHLCTDSYFDWPYASAEGVTVEYNRLYFNRTCRAGCR